MQGWHDKRDSQIGLLFCQFVWPPPSNRSAPECPCPSCSAARHLEGTALGPQMFVSQRPARYPRPGERLRRIRCTGLDGADDRSLWRTCGPRVAASRPPYRLTTRTPLVESTTPARSRFPKIFSSQHRRRRTAHIQYELALFSASTRASSRRARRTDESVTAATEHEVPANGNDQANGHADSCAESDFRASRQCGGLPRNDYRCTRFNIGTRDSLNDLSKIGNLLIRQEHSARAHADVTLLEYPRLDRGEIFGVTRCHVAQDTDGGCRKSRVG